MTSIQFDATPTSHTGNYYINVSTTRANMGETHGIDNISYLKVSDGVQEKTAKLVQYAEPALIPTGFNPLVPVPQQGGMISYMLLSHYPVKAENVPDYITIKVGGAVIPPDTRYTPPSRDTITQRSDGIQVNLIFDANNTGSDRSTNNTFRMRHYSGNTVTDRMIYINTTQSGTAVDTINVTPSDLYFPQTGKTMIFYVTTAPGVAWTITGKPSWLTLSKTAGTGNTEVTATTAANSSDTMRIASMSAATATDWVTLTAHQEGRQELRLTATTTGTIKWHTTNPGWICSIQYSKNNGAWTDITPTVSGTSISVTAGDNVRFRGAHSTYGNSSGMYCYFGGTAKFNVSGYLYSLLQYTEYAQSSSQHGAYLTQTDNFRGLFKGSRVVNASGLTMQENTLRTRCYMEMFKNCQYLVSTPSLPAMGLAEACYSNMFQGCVLLASAPDLPARYMAPESYSEMFDGCTDLGYVKCYAISMDQGSTYRWLRDVATQGVFWYDPDADFWFTGDSGIPQNWVWKRIGVD